MSLNKFSNTQIGLEIGLEIGCETLECNNLIVNDSIILPPTLIIDNLTVNNLLVNEECKVKCVDNSFVNFTTPTNGNLADVLSTDGNGNTYWSSSPVPPGSGIIFNGVLPAENSRILKLSNVAGTTANSSCLIEDVTNLTCDKILKVQDIDGAVASELKIGQSVSVLTLLTEPVLGSIDISSNTITSSSTSFTWNSNQIATLADIPVSSTLQDIYDNSTPAEINYTDANPIDFKNSEGNVKLHIEKTFVGIHQLKVDDISPATGLQVTVLSAIEGTSFVKTGGLVSQFLMADGSTTTALSPATFQDVYNNSSNPADVVLVNNKPIIFKDVLDQVAFIISSDGTTTQAGGIEGGFYKSKMNTIQRADTDDAKIEVIENIPLTTIRTTFTEDQEFITKLYVDSNVGTTNLQQAYNASIAIANPAVVEIDYSKSVKFLTNDGDNILTINAGTFAASDYRIEADRAVFNALTSTTSNSGSFVKAGGTASQYLMANGSSLEYSANSGNSNFYLYNSIDNITSPPPASGKVGYNNANQSLATILYINHLTSDNIDIDVFFAQLTTIQDVYLQDRNSSLNFIRYNITATPTIIPNNYISIPVLYTATIPPLQPNGGGTGLTSFGVNHPIIVSFFTNSIEVDMRLSTLESKTQNQTAILNTTTFTGSGGIISNGGFRLSPTSTNILLGDGTSQPQSLFTTPSQVNLLNKLSGTYQITFSQTAGLSSTSSYLPVTALIAIGGATISITPANTTIRTRIFKVQNPTLSTADGSKSGYIGSGATATWPYIFGQAGWNWNQSFGIGDTNTTTTAVTQMFVGLTLVTVLPPLGSAQGPNTTPSIMGIGHDVGDSVISFYYRGTSGGVKIATTFSAITPSPYWFNLNISNDVASDVCILTLTDIITDTTFSQFFILTSTATTTTMSYNVRLFPLNCRAMGVLGGITGSAITQFSRFELSLQ
jgi:hypothetical protein